LSKRQIFAIAGVAAALSAVGSGFAATDPVSALPGSRG